MAKAPTLSDVSNILTSATTINTNNDAVEASFENTLSLDGSTPNAMGADLDMNSNDILNAGTIQASDITVDGGNITGLIERAENSVVEAEAQAAIATAQAGNSATSATESEGFRDEAEAFAAILDPSSYMQNGPAPTVGSPDRDFNTLIVGGLYSTISTWDNAPPDTTSVSANGTCLVMERVHDGGAQITQIVSVADADGSNPALYTRVGAGGPLVWGDWKEMAFLADITTTVDEAVAAVMPSVITVDLGSNFTVVGTDSTDDYELSGSVTLPAGTYHITTTFDVTYTGTPSSPGNTRIQLNLATPSGSYRVSVNTAIVRPTGDKFQVPVTLNGVFVFAAESTFNLEVTVQPVSGVGGDSWTGSPSQVPVMFTPVTDIS